MRTHNISTQFLLIFDLIYDAVIYCWRFLDSIKILDAVSILDICIATLLIGTFLPIIIGLAGHGVSASSGYARRSRIHARTEADRNRYLARKQKIADSINRRR